MKFTPVSCSIICLVMLYLASNVNAEQGGSLSAEQYTIQNLKQVSSADLSSHIDNHDGTKPLFVYVTRLTSSDINALTDKIAKAYSDRVDFIFVDIPAGSMRAFRDIESVTKKYKIETLPVSVVLMNGEMLARVDLIGHKKDPEKIYRKRMQSVLSRMKKQQ